MSQFQQLRVVHPLSPTRTVVYTYNFRLKGAPPSMFRRTIAFANVVNGTGSLVLTDDLETYGRIGAGLASEGAEWLQIGRGYASDRDNGDGGRRGLNSTSEIFIRNMFDAWLGYMTADAMTLTQAAAEAFCCTRRGCLDEARWDDWLALFTDDATVLGPVAARPAEPPRHGFAHL